MPIQTLKISLVASNITSLTEFFKPLNLEEDEQHVVIRTHDGEGIWENQVSVVEFFNDSRVGFENSGEAIMRTIADEAWTCGLQVANWINQRREVLLELEQRLHIALEIEFTIDANESLVAFPPELLSACGQARVEMWITSNIHN